MDRTPGFNSNEPTETETQASAKKIPTTLLPPAEKGAGELSGNYTARALETAA